MRLSHPIRILLTALAALVALAATTGLVITGGPASAASGHGSEPGSLTGYGFDACSAPAQPVMDAWWEASPYSAVGIYIGGSTRLCDQPELSATWVHKQQKRGWHLLPLYVGPQASCSGYADIMSADLATAQQQGQAQATAAVAAASGLGIKSGSTLYYDLEDYDIAPDDCRRAALSFLSGWTDALHGLGYDSGVYSNIAAAITSLDYADRVSPGSYTMPDDIWFAWANGRADAVTDDRVQSSRWDDHARVHQYEIDTPATYGGYSMTINSSWADVGKGSVPPKDKPLCKGVDVDLRHYPAPGIGTRSPSVSAAQCLLRRQHFTSAPITGRYDARTAAAVRKAQHTLDLKETGRLTGATWAALLGRGNHPVLKIGSTGDAVLRLQRSLTAALGRPTRIDGAYSTKTAKAVKKYQRKHHLDKSGVVTDEVWDALLGG